VGCTILSSIPCISKRPSSPPNCPGGLWTNPTFYSGRTYGSFPGGKRQGCEGNHLPPCSAKVQNGWISGTCLLGVDGDKFSNNIDCSVCFGCFELTLYFLKINGNQNVCLLLFYVTVLWIHASQSTVADRTLRNTQNVLRSRSLPTGSQI